ncbi:sterol-binding-like protein [Conidiobolus coronatus NRRL 28638]|uniref:Sterol-binding-like protein n=1 Tax=Conidiobolus coronatus (strain ATCC 28846 / CBS 209.66 / NRRL 28638) TaxID=796925 RepID=A0A137PBZ6_CONC2|nr:sterol-binding-like protein [Conidiobolus coronatus NRRL 28638]|eukprot:KXN72519.1 sterol-binding-like protein [Conidiobolus coronatus NRRL 28638]
MTNSAGTFEIIDAAFKSFDIVEAEKLINDIKAVYLFEIKNGKEAEYWTIDLKNSKPKAKRGLPDKADEAIITDEDSFVELFEGKANALDLFMQGKIRVKGNMGLTTKLDSLFRAVRAKNCKPLPLVSV